VVKIIINAKLKETIRKAIFWMFLLFLCYLIFELVNKILGGSLGFQELTIGLLLANLGFSFHLIRSIRKSELDLRKGMNQINLDLKKEIHQSETNLKAAITEVDTKLSEHICWDKLNLKK